VKRFLVLLVVVAGGLAAASFGVPSNAAVVNGQAITENQLNVDLTAIANSTNGVYDCYLNAETAIESQGQGNLPTLQGAGSEAATGPHTSITTAFAASYLDTAIGHQILLQLAARHHVHVTAAALTAAKAELTKQISGILSEASQSDFACSAPSGAAVLKAVPDSFVQESVAFDATVTQLENKLSGFGTSAAGQRRFFDQNRSLFDSACITVGSYTSEADAVAAKGVVYEGGSFATLAAQTPGGGPQGCPNLYDVLSQVPASSDLGTLALNQVSAPIDINGQYLLIEITQRSPSAFANVRSEVQKAVQNIGAANTQTALAVAERKAQVSVNPRYGSWKATAEQIVTPEPPQMADVLNATANGSSSTSIPAASSGQSG
jgi:hypothetical protein